MNCSFLGHLCFYPRFRPPLSDPKWISFGFMLIVKNNSYKMHEKSETDAIVAFPKRWIGYGLFSMLWGGRFLRYLIWIEISSEGILFPWENRCTTMALYSLSNEIFPPLIFTNGFSRSSYLCCMHVRRAVLGTLSVKCTQWKKVKVVFRSVS